MTKPILYTETTDKLTIQIFPSMKPIVKFGLALQGISIIAFSIGYTIFILSMIQSFGIASLAMIVGAIIYYIIGRMYIRRVFYQEVIEVTKEELTVMDKYPGSTVMKQYPLPEIFDLGFAGQRPFTEHPLTGKSTDYLGWGVYVYQGHKRGS